MSTLAHDLVAFGAPEESVVGIDASLGYQHMDYLDLPALPQGLPRVTAVVEMAGRPVLYVVRGTLSPEVLDSLCHILAQRGTADHLGLLEPGRLTVVPLLRSESARKRKKPHVWEALDPSAKGRLPGLAFGTIADNTPATARRLHDDLVKLLTNATEVIVDKGGVKDPADALSLVGRALFLRFLIDRKIVDDSHVSRICPDSPSLLQSMDTPGRVSATSTWLNTAFNGNMLPLSGETPMEFWEGVRKPAIVCSMLARILAKSDATGQLRFDWDTLDFSHIPVGLLSQVYERWCHTFARNKAIRDSVWYTPRSIAEYLVDEAFFDLPNPHAARVLDPAVGAGVFLVAAYREIVRARWRHDNARPNRRVLREILYNQLVGFDVNEASLRLAALALYLTAIELDPDPHPLNRLRFADLRQRGVLCDVKSALDEEAEDLPMVGSLGSSVSDAHRGRYDVVLGNPPWTSWASGKGSDERVWARRHAVEELITKIAKKRLQDTDAPSFIRFEMVDFDPDLAFCWRALDWARPNGVVALALHARLLFRQSPMGVAARSQLFEAAAVSGILNGAALAQTQVWPSHEAPFCLWFATNRRARPEDTFFFISPVVDRVLNRRGYLRVDAAAARPLTQRQVIEHPWLLKTCFRGSPLDVDIMSRIMGAGRKKVQEYWEDENLACSRGYIVGGARSKKHDYDHLNELPDVSSLEKFSVRVTAENMPKFEPRPLKYAPPAKAFSGPLVLVFEAPRHDRLHPRALFASSSIAYDDSFHGFSTAGHAHPDELARYLLVLFNSNLILYVALMRSGTFGASRKRLNLKDLKDFPFIPLGNLSEAQRSRIRDVAEMALTRKVLPQEQIDSIICDLYGLSPWDVQAIRDTLDVALPFASSVSRAQEPPSSVEIAAFAKNVQDILDPVLSHVGRHITVEPMSLPAGLSWFCIRIISREKSGRTQATQSHLGTLTNEMLSIATDAGVSRVVMREKKSGYLCVGIFAQYRYWTLSQARQLALDLLGDAEHEAWLRGGVG